jgi:hypothetical protein
MRASLAAIRETLMRRRHEPVPILGKWLGACDQRLFELPRGAGHRHRMSGFSAKCAAFGDMPCCAEASDIDCHGADLIAWFENTYRRAEQSTHFLPSDFTSIPLTGAVCGSPARTDLRRRGNRRQYHDRAFM